MGAMKPQVREDLHVVEFGDELVVYQPTGYHENFPGLHGNLHYFNPQGALVFKLCDGLATTQQTAAQIADAYGADVAQVEPQVRSLVQILRRNGLLVQKPILGRRELELAREAGHLPHHDHDHDHPHDHPHDHAAPSGVGAEAAESGESIRELIRIQVPASD